MANREAIRNEKARGYIGSHFFYTNSAAVGYGCQNNPEDVRLIQFLMNRFHEMQVLVMDGIYGGKTWRVIKNFQDLWGVKGGAGTVSSVDGTRYLSPKTGEPYTIYSLNEQYCTYHPEYWPDPRRDPMFPMELESHLWGPLPQLV